MSLGGSHGFWSVAAPRSPWYISGGMLLAPETRAKAKRALMSVLSALKFAAAGGVLGALCATAIPEHLPLWREVCRLAVHLIRLVP